MKKKDYLEEIVEDNLLELKIPDEQILEINGKLAFKFMFENNRYFLMQVPSFAKFQKFHIEVVNLMYIIQRIDENMQVMNLDDIKQDSNSKVFNIAKSLVDNYINIFANREVRYRIFRILKKYFVFRPFIYNRRTKYLLTFRQFKKQCSIIQFIIILACCINMSEFIKKNLTLINTWLEVPTD